MNKFFLILLICMSCACSQSETREQSSPIKEQPTSEAIPQTAVAESRKVSLVTASIDTTISTDYIMGKFEPTKDPRFIQVPPKYVNGRKDRFLRKETYTAFLKMYQAAKKEGIELKILSATRNFATQKIIWEGKWTGKRLHESKENLAKTTPNPTKRALKILKWSSMPGTSRHHWGTDIDLNAFTNSYFEKGEGLKVYTWLTTHAKKYGFCQPYSPKGKGGRPDGYNEEKWHWSYLPIAQPLTTQARLRLKDSMIQGFKGAETAASIGVVDKFILGINGDCLINIQK